MNKIRRTLSILVRHAQTPFATRNAIRQFMRWCNEQKALSFPQPVCNKLLIIRLDEIGDYILWRNSLHVYKLSAKWKHYHITLIGNQAWKSLFDFADKSAVDATIWIDKIEYKKNAAYRLRIWEQLRKEGFETVICPTRIRTVWFDDFCAMATGSSEITAVKHVYSEKKINKVLHNLYKHVYSNNRIYHEFLFNQDFVNWCCSTSYYLKRPQIEAPLFCRIDEDYILCYIGASKKSRRVSPDTWIDLIKQLKQQYQKKIIIAGGPAEMILSKQIANATEADDITGQVCLAEMVHYTAFADAVITGDTMQSHLAASCNIPTVIIANGNTFARFSEYKAAGIPGVETVYAKPFLKVWKKKNHILFANYLAVTNDIRTIGVKDILEAVWKVKPDL